VSQREETTDKVSSERTQPIDVHQLRNAKRPREEEKKDDLRFESSQDKAIDSRISEMFGKIMRRLDSLESRVAKVEGFVTGDLSRAIVNADRAVKQVRSAQSPTMTGQG
jgi:hypothetical protein